MTRIAILVALLGAFAAPASAECYTVYQRNIIVYRSDTTPIDLEGPIHAALQKRFPGGQLVISDAKLCTYIDPSSPVDPTTGAAADAGGTVSTVSAQRTTVAAKGAASPDAAAVEVDEGCRRGGTVTRRGQPCPDVVVGDRVVGAQEGAVTERAKPMLRR